ncbi:cytochrome c-type biogenesis protein [Tropicimonas marinistellae]|uniref:cytochrome c-type biogenesis protein n=1 Tax=Tropicimonas marinistellae TaxID=1739787 RepID=UPI0008355175|nr:cytochrome c-type biogenesis protein [Tropicimonas marinistellae]
MKRLFVVLALLVAQPSLAVTPDEILDDPELEARARDISKGLRCLVCRNENIDESNAELAADLRVLVRERLLEGDSNDEVLDYVVGRYGEYVLLKPTTQGANLILWIAGPAMLLLAAGGGLAYVRRRGQAPDAGATVLSAEEEARLKDILDD